MLPKKALIQHLLSWCKHRRFPWWHHQMETFSALVALCEGNHRSPVDSPHTGQRWRALMFTLICAWTNGWANTRDTGDLRRHRAHYDVTEPWQKIVARTGGQFWRNCAEKLLANFLSAHLTDPYFGNKAEPKQTGSQHRGMKRSQDFTMSGWVRPYYNE